MNLREQLDEHIKEAMKAKEKDRLTLLRSIKATFKNREIELGTLLDGKEQIALILKMIKQRKEAALGFRKGKAEERALHEDWEATLLESYLPPAPSPEELSAAIEAEIEKLSPEARTAKAMGSVMKALQDVFSDRPLDGKALSTMVKAKLS